MTTEAKPKAGLEDVVAASSAICYLDGDRGVLAYYGYDIHDLARGRLLRGSLLPPVARPLTRTGRSWATCSPSSPPPVRSPSRSFV